MAIDWPASPAVGDLYPTTVTNGDPQWVWAAAGAWNLVNKSTTIVTGTGLRRFIGVNDYVSSEVVFFRRAKRPVNVITYV